jgi:hypothetical protein
MLKSADRRFPVIECGSGKCPCFIHCICCCCIEKGGYILVYMVSELFLAVSELVLGMVIEK